MTAIIEIRDVARRFGAVTAVDGVNLSVAEGSVMSIVGESGCGKSTLARLILGLLPPDAGEIRVAGQRLDTLDRRARARLIQPIFQDPYASLNPRQRIRDIVALPLRAQGERDVDDRVLAILGR
ncbi:MAG: ATP-binding cassette domain-containing protein, partial [Janthinobacterium lividum]